MLIGSVNVLGGRIATMALQFLTLVIIGRGLGPAGFGVLQFTLTLFIFLGLAADLGSTILGTRRIARGEVQAAPHLLAARAVQAMVVAALVVAAALVAPLSLDHRGMILILTVGLLATTTSVRWFLQGSGRFRDIAVADGVAGAVQVAAAAILVNSPDDLPQAALVMVSGPLISHLIMRVQTRGSSYLRLRVTRTMVGSIRAAAPIGLAIMASQIYYGADSILLGIMRTPDEVGWYGAAYRIVLACLALPVAAHSVALTMFARDEGLEGQDLGAVRVSITRWLIALCLPLAVGTSICAEMIVRVVFGPPFAASATPLAILIWSTVTVSANAAFGAWMLSQGHDRRYMRVTLTACTVNVAMNLVAIPAFGIVGASCTTVVTELLVLILIVRSTSVGATSAIVSALRRAILPTAAMALVLVPIRTSLVAVPIGMVVYLGASVITGALPVARVFRLIAARIERH